MIQTLFEVKEKKQPRMVKHCDTAIKYLQTKLGKDTLKDKAVNAFARK